jgi:hypothetical protein
MTDVDIPILERPAFFDGQLLTAADLAAVQGYERELGWLHNRALHDWGVAFGMYVHGRRGDRAVQVEPGYALDCKGRDLILDDALTLQVPPVAGARDGSPARFYLTVSYLEDADIEPETRAGVCDADGAVRRPERCRVRWQDPADVDPIARYRPGLDVVLAGAEVQNCRLAKDVSLAERRDAVAVLRPYVAAGRTPPGATSWDLWPSAIAPIGVTADVSTAAAGFPETPRYYARVAGTRRFQGTFGGVQRTFVVDGYAQVDDATASGFTLRVLLPSANTLVPETYTVTTADLENVVLFSLTRVAEIAEGDLSQEVVSAFGQASGLDQPGATLETGTDLAEQVGASAKPSWLESDMQVKVQPADFYDALAEVAPSLGVSTQTLVIANNLQAKPHLTVGEALVVPGTVLALNPPNVLGAELLSHLRSTLDWHVVWTGVEG